MKRFGSEFHEIHNILPGCCLRDLDIACENFPNADGLVGRKCCGRLGLDHDLIDVISQRVESGRSSTYILIR